MQRPRCSKCFSLSCSSIPPKNAPGTCISSLSACCAAARPLRRTARSTLPISRPIAFLNFSCSTANSPTPSATASKARDKQSRRFRRRAAAAPPQRSPPPSASCTPCSYSPQSARFSPASQRIFCTIFEPNVFAFTSSSTGTMCSTQFSQHYRPRKIEGSEHEFLFDSTFDALPLLPPHQREHHGNAHESPLRLQPALPHLHPLRQSALPRLQLSRSPRQQRAALRHSRRAQSAGHHRRIGRRGAPPAWRSALPFAGCLARFG